ncbi:MAG: C39 family peptidase [Methanobacteriaceae archaeon]
MIGTTPAVAIQFEEMTQTVDMTVRGRGADVAAASELAEVVVNENNTSTGQNNITTETSNTNNASVTSANDDPVPAEATGADTQIYDLNDTTENLTVPQATEDTQTYDLNDTTENITIPQIDTSGIVMQSTDYSCGPAALATVLQNMGFNSTEGELKVLAGTDTSGTSMYGLARAAHAKGVSATGMRLSIDDLKRNHIVHVVLNGTPHYSVVREVSENSVRLADPSLGNIVMTREEFNEIYTGHTLVISNSNVQLNQTATSKNLTVIPNVQVNQTATSKNLTVSVPNVQVNQPVANNTYTGHAVTNVQEVNQTANNTNISESKNLTVSAPNQTATSKNLTVINPNVQEVNQTANNTYTGHALVLTNVQEVNQANNTNTSEIKNLTVINPNVQLNQTATSKNLTVINPNVQLNQTATDTSKNLTVITDPNNLTQLNEYNQTNSQLNQSTENTNLLESVNNSTDTNSSNVQVDSSATLTKDEMQNIIGMGWRRRRRRRCWDVDTPSIFTI